jgi:hypothetical protein
MVLGGRQKSIKLVLQERLHTQWAGQDVKLDGLVRVTMATEAGDAPGMAVYDTASAALAIRYALVRAAASAHLSAQPTEHLAVG